MIFTRWRNLLSTDAGEETRLPWDDFCAEFSRLRKFTGQDSHPGWSPARFRNGKRSKETVERVFALCLDYDNGDSIDHARELWGGFCGLLHTTRKHTADAPRFRVILPLKRGVSPFEFGALWERAFAHAGETLDPAPKDPSRFWFVPGVGNHEGAEFVAERFEGPALDPDEWLAKSLGTHKPVTTDADLRAAVRPADSYAAAALAAEVRTMGEAGEGERNATLNRCAFALGQLVAGGLLSESTVDAELSAAARAVGLKEREINITLRSGLTSGKKHPRTAPERPETYRRHDNANDLAEQYAEQARECNATPYDVEDEPPPEDPEAEPVDARPAIERYGLLSEADLIKLVCDAMRKPREQQGVPTCSKELDEAIGKYRRGNVTILGAKRRFGKTSYSIMVSDYAQTIDPPRRVLVFAGEDSAMMYGQRYTSLRAGINGTKLRDMDVSAADIQRADAALTSAPRVPFFARVEGRPVEWVAKCIGEVCAEGDVELVIVDYLQCLKAGRRQQDRRNEVTYVARTLIDAIKKANAAGLLLSQLRRTERERPEVEDLKESGDLEDMAEHVLLGHLRTARNEPAERTIIVAKNKDGPDNIDDIPLLFDEQVGRLRPDYGFAGRSRREPPPMRADDYGIPTSLDEDRPGAWHD